MLIVNEMVYVQVLASPSLAAKVFSMLCLCVMCAWAVRVTQRSLPPSAELTVRRPPIPPDGDLISPHTCTTPDGQEKQSRRT